MAINIRLGALEYGAITAAKWCVDIASNAPCLPVVRFQGNAACDELGKRHASASDVSM